MSIKYLLLVIGFTIISACASNEANMDADESNATAAEEAIVEEAIVEEAVEEAIVEEAVEEAIIEEAVEEAVEEAAEEEATSDSGNLVSTCTNGDHVRIITVVYDNDATDTVCEVTYEKSTGVQTLWTANADRDYCLDQATAFVQKQEGWGWTCSNLE